MTLNTQLRNQHTRILLMLSEIESMLGIKGDKSGELDAGFMYGKVCHLMRWVMVHLEFEQTEVYPTLRRVDNAPASQNRSECWRIGEEIDHIKPLMARYEQRFCDAGTIAGDTEKFVAATLEVSRQLRARFRREAQLVYPVADQLAKVAYKQPKYLH